MAAWGFGLRKGPQHDVAALVRAGGVKALLPIGSAHGLGQVATVLSLGAGAVSFTHIVKALEPLFSAAVSAVVSGEVLRPQVYAALLPVVGGVSLAVAKEMSFSWWAFSTAMLSNLAFALRAVLSKDAMMGAKKTEGGGGGKAAASTTTTTPGEAIAALSAPSLFGVVTCLSFVLMAPLALLAEGRGAPAAWSAAVLKLTETTTQQNGGGVSGGGARGALAKSVLLSGLFHYFNNEVMYLVLDNVHPVTLAVGNTLKRVVIIVASLLIFRNPMAPAAQLGSAVGIAGVLLYSLTKQHYDRIDAAAATKSN
jgi:solute carrier family 35 protein E1